jgi:hypothetical protein
MLYIIGINPIMSRFLINKLDIFKAITLIIAMALRVLPYFITLLGKNYLYYMFYL